MFYNINKMEYADIIEKLPTDKENSTNEELNIINSIFIEDTGVYDKVVSEIKEVLILFILFILISMSKTTNIIQIYLPICKNDWYLIIFKGFILSCLFWIIKNIYLMRPTGN